MGRGCGGVGGCTAPYVGDVSLYFCGIMSALTYASKPHTLLSDSVCCLSSKTSFYTRTHSYAQARTDTDKYTLAHSN